MLLFLRQASALLLQPGAVVPLVRNAGAAIELQNPSRNVVEEVPVVGYRYDCPRELGEIPLQPGD